MEAASEPIQTTVSTAARFSQAPMEAKDVLVLLLWETAGFQTSCAASRVESHLSEMKLPIHLRTLKARMQANIEAISNSLCRRRVRPRSDCARL